MHVAKRVSVKVVVWAAALLLPCHCLAILDCPCVKMARMAEPSVQVAEDCCKSHSCRSHRDQQLQPIVGFANGQPTDGSHIAQNLHRRGVCCCPPECVCKQHPTLQLASSDLGSNHRFADDLVVADTQADSATTNVSRGLANASAVASGPWTLTGPSLCVTLCRLTV